MRRKAMQCECESLSTCSCMLPARAVANNQCEAANKGIDSVTNSSSRAVTTESLPCVL